MKSSIIFLAIIMLGATLAQKPATSHREIIVKKNMVYISEDPKIRTADFTVEAVNPTELKVTPITSEVDPDTEVKELNEKAEVIVKKENAKERRVKKKLSEFKKETKKLDEKKNQLNKSIISIKELLEKYRSHIKVDEKTPETQEFKAKLEKSMKEVEQLENKKAKVEKLENSMKQKVQTEKIRLEKIESKKQMKHERDPKVDLTNQKKDAIHKCDALIQKKEVALKKVDHLKEEADKIEKKLKMETSKIVQEELKEQIKKVKTEYKKMEKSAKKMTKKIKQKKKVIKKCSTTLKYIKKELMKEKLKDMIKGKCTAYTIRPHRKYCTKRNKHGVCTSYKSLYRTSKCLVYDGDKCVDKSYKYNRNASRYECVSRNEKYKIKRCVKFGNDGKCIKTRHFYGVKSCLSYATNGKKIVCTKKKVVFPEYTCKKKVNDICKKIVYHRPRFYCKTYSINKDGHRYCSKKDVYYGEENYEFICVKNGSVVDKATGKKKNVGCVEYKKRLVPGAEKLEKVGKTWLKEHCNALSEDPNKKVSSVKVSKTKSQTEVEACKRKTVEKKKKLRDEQAMKIIENCKAQIKDKLRAVREAKRIVKRQEQYAKKVKRSSEAKTHSKDSTTESQNRKEEHQKNMKSETDGKTHSKNSREVSTNAKRHVQKMSEEQKKKIQAFETYSKEKTQAEKNLIKKAKQVIIEQKKKLTSKDPKIIKKAKSVIKKERAEIRKSKSKLTEITNEGLKKWRVGKVIVSSKKILKSKVKVLEKAAEKSYMAKKEILSNKKLLRETKDLVVKKRCERIIKKAKRTLKKAKKVTKEAKKEMKKITDIIKKRLGIQEIKKITKAVKVYTKTKKVVDNCNKKILTASRKIEDKEVEITKCKKHIKEMRLKLQKNTDPKIQKRMEEELKKIEKNKELIKKSKVRINKLEIKKLRKIRNPKIVLKEANDIKEKQIKRIQEMGEKCAKKLAQFEAEMKTAINKVGTQNKIIKKSFSCQREITKAKILLKKANLLIIKKLPFKKAVRKADELVSKSKKTITKLRNVIDNTRKDLEDNKKKLIEAKDKMTKKLLAEKIRKEKELIKKTKKIVKKTTKDVRDLEKAKTKKVRYHNKRVKEIAAEIKTQKTFISKKADDSASSKNIVEGKLIRDAKHSKKIAKKCYKQIKKSRKVIRKGKKVIRTVVKEISMKIRVIRKEQLEVMDLRKSIRKMVANRKLTKILISKGGKRKVRVKVSEARTEMRNIRQRIRVLVKNIKHVRTRVYKDKRVLRKIKRTITKAGKKLRNNQKKMWTYEPAKTVKSQVLRLNKSIKKKIYTEKEYIRVKSSVIRRYQRNINGTKKLIREDRTSKQYTKKQLVEFRRHIRVLTKRIKTLKRRISSIKRRIRRRRRRVMKNKLIIIKKETNPEDVKKDIIKLNKGLRKKIYKGLEYIKKHRPLIKKYQREIRTFTKKIRSKTHAVKTVKVFRRNIKQLKKLIRTIRRNIRRIRKSVSQNKRQIIRNKMIIVRRFQKTTGSLLKKRILARVLKSQIRTLKRRVRSLDRKVVIIDKRIRVCVTPACRSQERKGRNVVTKQLKRYRLKIRDAKRSRVSLMRVVKTLKAIRLVRTYYKRRLTCNVRENWRIFNIIRRQRLKLIKRSTKNIMTVQQYKNKNSSNMVAVWKRIIAREVKAISSDRTRVRKILKSCRRIRFLKNKALIFRKLITGSTKKTCSSSRLTKITTKIVSMRETIISKIKGKLTKDMELVKITSDPKKKAEYKLIIKKSRLLIQRQLRNVANDRRRILRLIKQCKVLKSSTLTIVRKQSGVTCNPVQLRDRVQKIVGDVFVTIQTAQIGIKRNEEALRTTKNDTEVRVIRNRIRKYRRTINRSNSKVKRDKAKLSKIIKVCRKYGFIVKTNVFIQKYTETSLRRSTAIKNFHSSWVNLSRFKTKAYIYKKIITRNPRITCRLERIAEIVRRLIKQRQSIIEKTNRKIEIAKKSGKNGQELVRKFRHLIIRQKRNISKDRIRILRVIDQCKKIERSRRQVIKYTIIRKNLINGGKNIQVRTDNYFVSKERYLSSYIKLISGGNISKGVVSKNPRKTCELRRIAKITRKIIYKRYRVMRKIRRQLRKIPRKSTLRSKYYRVLARQRRNIRRDRKRILYVIRRCSKINRYRRFWIKNSTPSYRHARTVYTRSWTRFTRYRRGSKFYSSMVTKNPRTTCNKQHIAKVARRFISYRKRIIRRARRRYSRLSRSSKPRSRSLAAKYRRIIKRQYRNIRKDRRRVIRVVRQCRSLMMNRRKWKRYSSYLKYNRANRHYWKSWLKLISYQNGTGLYSRIISSSAKKTCSQKRIRYITRTIVHSRRVIITSTKRKISALRSSHNAKANKYIVSLRRLVKRQYRNIKRDKRRILRVIRQCNKIEGNKRTLKGLKKFYVVRRLSYVREANRKVRVRRRYVFRVVRAGKSKRRFRKWRRIRRKSRRRRTEAN